MYFSRRPSETTSRSFMWSLKEISSAVSEKKMSYIPSVGQGPWAQFYDNRLVMTKSEGICRDKPLVKMIPNSNGFVEEAESVQIFTTLKATPTMTTQCDIISSACLKSTELNSSGCLFWHVQHLEYTRIASQRSLSLQMFTIIYLNRIKHYL